MASRYAPKKIARKEKPAPRDDAPRHPPKTPKPAVVKAPQGDDGGDLVRGYAALLDPVTEQQRTAFARQCPDAKADALGGRTRAVNVLGEGTRFARLIQAVVGNREANPRDGEAPKGGLAYSKARFRYLLELLDALRTQIGDDAGGDDATRNTKQDAKSAHDAALAAREVLIERLEAFVSGDAARERALASAYGSTKNDEATIASLASLAKFARGLVSSPDAEDRALAASVSLSEAAVADVDAARKALVEAHGGAVGAGPVVARDTPEANRIEGRVLFELQYAMRLFEGAHARDRLCPRLVPTAATRAVLGHSARKPPAEDPPPAA